MDPESKQLLRDTYELADQNNKMLRHIRRSQKVTSFLRFMYWMIIIGIGVGSFYFLQPYVENIQTFIKDSGASLNQIKTLGNKLPF
ncbi:MAG: hypothetical protein WC264_00230 [Candidatus Paceibacterota bacterium]|jgi:hypothetical protein